MSTINNQPVADNLAEPLANNIVDRTVNNIANTGGATVKDGDQVTGKAKGVEPAPSDNLISISDFGRVELRVGQILEAENIPKSEKLLKLKVTLGEDKGPRQILAGIAKHYKPESLILRKVVVVANLAPAKLMGNMSEGMLLCASSSDDGYLELLAPSDLAPIGSIVR